jgi:hypothetical protein
MKPAQPLALPLARALIDPLPSPVGEQGPALHSLALGPVREDAPWTSRLTAPAWQPFQVAGVKVGGAGPGRGASGRPDGGRVGGGRPGGRTAGDPRSHPPTMPVTGKTVEAAANRPASKPTNGAAHPAGAKGEAQKVVGPEIRFIRPDGKPPAQRLAEALKANGDKAADKVADGAKATRPADARPAAKPPEADSPKAQMDAKAADLKAQLQKISTAAARDAASAYVKLNGNDPANGRFGHDTPTSRLLDGVNEVKGTKNCQPCVVATVLRTMGVDASARNVAGKDLPMAKLEAFFGAKFEPMKLGKIFEAMGNAKDGAVAVVHGVRDNGQDGHVFTARKVDGRVRFEDGQTGKPADFAKGYTSFRFMQVK